MNISSITLLTGKVKAKRERLLPVHVKNPQISRKFANARWIYQQIQNRVGTCQERRGEEERPVIIPLLDDMESFAPKVTSTPIKQRSNPSDRWNENQNSPLHGSGKDSLEDAPVESSFGNHREEHSWSEFTFPQNVRVSTEIFADTKRSASFDQEMEWRSFTGYNKSLNTDKDESSANWKMKTDDSDWDDCFSKRNSIKLPVNQPQPGKKTRKRKQNSGKENVAIKNVKKLVMYVNNY